VSLVLTTGRSSILADYFDIATTLISVTRYINGSSICYTWTCSYISLLKLRRTPLGWYTVSRGFWFIMVSSQLNKGKSQMKKIVILAAATVLAIGGTASACLPGEQEDKCKNVEGIQSEVPEGLTQQGENCFKAQPIVDVEVQPETPKEEQPVAEQTPEVTTATVAKPVEQPAPAPAPAPQPVLEEFQGK
jgi:hypothetical protein